MKTLKILVVLCIILGFTSMSNAQRINEKVVWPFYWTSDCIGELLIGEAVFHLSWDPLLPWKFHTNAQGTLVGQTTGNIFKLHFQEIANEQLWSPEDENGAWISSYFWQVFVVGKGKAVNAKFTAKGHFVYGPEGDVILEKFEYSEDCK